MRREALCGVFLISQFVLVVTGGAQRLSVGANINAENFSGAPLAPLPIIRALVKFQDREKSLARIPDEDEAQKRFQAMPIDLGIANEQDFVILGTLPYSGGDNDWFWVVRMLPAGPKVVLWLHCLNFDFERKRTKGLPNVGSEWSSPNEMLEERFHFDGTRYLRVSHKSSPTHTDQ